MSRINIFNVTFFSVEGSHGVERFYRVILGSILWLRIISNYRLRCVDDSVAYLDTVDATWVT
jgi:hypothetical protein